MTDLDRSQPIAVSEQHVRLAEWIRAADSVVALTGAGVSVPSGIPDFRSPGTGLWERVNPMEVAHIDVFDEDPGRFWGFSGIACSAPRPARGSWLRCTAASSLAVA